MTRCSCRHVQGNPRCRILGARPKPGAGQGRA
jgi:hypothetical protein